MLPSDVDKAHVDLQTTTMAIMNTSCDACGKFHVSGRIRGTVVYQEVFKYYNAYSFWCQNLSCVHHKAIPHYVWRKP